MSIDKNKPSNNNRCYQAAIRFLARREHSRLELINKLKRKDFSEGVDLVSLCDELEALNYLSDARFTEMFIRSRSNRGQGEIKIHYELRQRGIAEALIKTAFSQADINWLKLAKQQREKRFGIRIPKDIKEKARQARFLMGRGFSGEIIRSVFN